MSATVDMKTCRRCERELPLSAYWRKSDSRDGYRTTCSECLIAAMRAGSDMVPVGPLREAFERSGASTFELAKQLGWMRPDSQRVRRQLFEREAMHYDRAVELALALGIDPTEVGL